jgi:predicted DNA-binding antitoxin AbrB/MazE fold protein
MLRLHVEAIYEGGVLRPLQPLNLLEHEQVSLVVAPHGPDLELEPTEYTSFVAEDADADMSWTEIQNILAKIPGSMVDDFDRERDERF